ncbi:hypothetical protein PQC13_gp244 [Synechococcus phage S-SRM01]|uniref:Uncharacterized protein n=1 Tax=Synechococcus phage S-SRM01 TaxID=2781608 RepID=A0A879R2S4_9CAUD|nr:hypothetical protein PQC13_gp244 [Synechococcus phage S-SRM01]QPX48209.1 hypothetical protein [Synechococcus phage S-SRM01]
MASGSFQFRYNHSNENAAWHTNPNTKFALPEEDVDIRCDDPYLNETQFLEMVRRFFIACGYTEKQWKSALTAHLKEAVDTE